MDVGDNRQRHAAAFAALAERHPQLLQHLQIAARIVLELDADRHLTVAGIEFRQGRTDVADGGDTDRLRQALGGDAETCREFGAGPDTQFRPVERGFRNHVGDDRNPLHLRRQLAGDVVDDVAVDPGHDKRNRAQAVLVEEPEADVRNVFQFLADLELELPLRDLAIGLRRVIDNQRGAAHFLCSRRHPSTIDEDALHLGPLAQAGDDFLRHLLGIGELRARRQLHREQRARGILRRQEALRQQCDAPDRGCEDAEADQHGDEIVLHRPGHQLGVGLQDTSGRRVLVRMILEEVSREHRRDEARGKQREEHLHRHGDAELLEELPGDPGHEAGGSKDRDNRQRDRDHGKADFVGGFECRAIGRFAHAHVAHDVLDLDDGVVDQNTRRQRDGEERDQVQREAEQVHRPERREDRQRQRNRSDDGGSDIAQEQQHDDHRKDCALEQGRDRRIVIALGEVDRGIDQLQIDIGIGNLQRIDSLLHGGGNHDVAGALGTLDAERHHRLAVEAGEGPAIGNGVGDRAEVVEPHLAAAEQRDHGAGKFVQRLSAGQRADCLVVLADFSTAAGEIDIGAAQNLADVDGGQPRGLQPVGIERDKNLALDTADTLDLRHAAHALQRAFDDVVDEIGKLLGRLAGRDRSVGDDRQADHVDALDQRLVDVLRQVGANAGDGVLDVIERAVGVGLQRELDRGHRQAVGDRG